MGYMGLKHWGDSDMAADAYHSAVVPMLKALSKAIKVRENSYNTSGPENVAMIVESGLLDSIPDYYIEEHFNYKALLEGLKANITDAGLDKKDQWGDEENRRSHLKSYQRMLKSVETFLKSKKIEIS
jgi:hypothetical protein